MKILVICFSMFAFSALAHEAIPTAGMPNGWEYGWDCCSAGDCYQELDANVREYYNGYLIVSTKEIIPYDDKRIRKSMDGYFHRCTPAGDPKMLRSLCLYVPPRSF